MLRGLKAKQRDQRPWLAIALTSGVRQFPSWGPETVGEAGGHEEEVFGMPQETVEQAFIERCRAIYRSLLPALLAKHRGNVIAIEPESGDYVLCENLDSASANALARDPNRRFGFFQVDEDPAVVKLR
jgi:hypothetical protein